MRLPKYIANLPGFDFASDRGIFLRQHCQQVDSMSRQPKGLGRGCKEELARKAVHTGRARQATWYRVI